MFKKLIGNREFYKRLIALALPIMVQNGITNFVNMLDNIMIGAVGTVQMTSVAIGNQLLFVFNLCIFGAVSGAGIFGSQFFGSNNHEGVRHTFRFKLIFGCFLTIAALFLFYFGGESLIGLYMKGDAGLADAVATLQHGKDYLRIMLIGLLPYTITQCYSSTLREGARPMLPMVAGVVAVVINLVFNYILIFGHFGAPALGVRGAAIATVLSRFVEMGIVVVATHKNKTTYPYMVGAYRSLYVPRKLIGQFFVKGLPLIINETLWASGVAVVNQAYSLRGLDSIAATNISQTFWNVFSIAFLAIGSSVGIILGMHLGANEFGEAKTSSYKMIAFSVFVSIIIGAIYFVCAEFIPLAYNTEPHIQSLATRLMQITAVIMPFEALTHASYFTLRSGGKMFITFLFDCGFTWVCNVLLATVLTNFTALPFLGIFAIVQSTTILKAFIGGALVKRGFWLKNIIDTQ